RRTARAAAAAAAGLAPPRAGAGQTRRGHIKRARLETHYVADRLMSLIVKICGLSTAEALDVALDEGADMVGFVFFPPSPRQISFEAARLFGERVRGRAHKVALTVDAD